MRIVLVEPNKAARPVEIEDNLQDMQALVGGPIQALYPWEDPGTPLKSCLRGLRYHSRNLFHLRYSR